VHTSWIIPEISAFAVSSSTGDFIDTTGCRNTQPLLCPNPVRTRPQPCAQGIIARAPDLLRRCLVNPSQAPLPIVQRVSQVQILLATTKARVDERCPLRITSSQLQAGTYLLTSGPECVIAGPGWTFQPGTTTTVSIRLLDEFVLPPDLDIELPTPPTDTDAPFNWTRLELLEQFQGEQVRALQRHPSHRWIATSGPTLSWTLLGVILVATAIGGGAWAQRKYRCLRWPQKKMAEPDTSAPTAPEADNPTHDDVTATHNAPPDAEEKKELFAKWPRVYPVV